MYPYLCSEYPIFFNQIHPRLLPKYKSMIETTYHQVLINIIPNIIHIHINQYRNTYITTDISTFHIIYQLYSLLGVGSHPDITEYINNWKEYIFTQMRSTVTASSVPVMITGESDSLVYKYIEVSVDWYKYIYERILDEGKYILSGIIITLVGYFMYITSMIDHIKYIMDSNSNSYILNMLQDYMRDYQYLITGDGGKSMRYLVRYISLMYKHVMVNILIYYMNKYQISEILVTTVQRHMNQVLYTYIPYINSNINIAMGKGCNGRVEVILEIVERQKQMIAKAESNIYNKRRTESFDTGNGGGTESEGSVATSVVNNRDSLQIQGAVRSRRFGRRKSRGESVGEDFWGEERRMVRGREGANSGAEDSCGEVRGGRRGVAAGTWGNSAELRGEVTGRAGSTSEESRRNSAVEDLVGEGRGKERGVTGTWGSSVEISRETRGRAGSMVDETKGNTEVEESREVTSGRRRRAGSMVEDSGAEN
jgi:hypothetical protein